MLRVWLEFVVCVALIWAAGARLSRYGDVIAEKTGLGRAWIGVIALATVTSLPELVTGVSAVSLAAAPNIALGDVLGSCVFNLMLITILDFLHRGESVFTRASQGHILAAGFGVILLGFVGFTILLAQRGFAPSVGHVGLSSPIIAVLYAISVRTVFRYEKRERAAYVQEVAEQYPHLSLWTALRRYAQAAVVVVVTGIYLPFVGERMAAVMGWRQTFVGSLFVAFATSVPEVAVTVAALRIGALDMAMANLFGSNLFNVLLIALDDLVFLPGPILSEVSPVHAVSSLSAVMMTGITVVGLLYRPKARLLRGVGWAGLLLFSLYLLNSYVLFLYGG